MGAQCEASMQRTQPLRYQNICRYRQLRVVVKRVHAVVFIVSICCLSIAGRVTLAHSSRAAPAYQRSAGPSCEGAATQAAEDLSSLPGYPIISNEFPQAGPAIGLPRLSVPVGLADESAARHSWPGSDSDGQKMEPLLSRDTCAAVAGGYHRDCLLQYQAVPPCEKPRRPPLRTRPGCS